MVHFVIASVSVHVAVDVVRSWFEYNSGRILGVARVRRIPEHQHGFSAGTSCAKEPVFVDKMSGQSQRLSVLL